MTGFLMQFATQDNKRLHGDLQKAGCYFLTMAAMAQVHFGKMLNVDQINDLYLACRQHPEIVRTDAYNTCVLGQGHCEIAAMASEAMAERWRVTNIGMDNRNGKSPSFWGSVIQSMNYSFDFTVIHYQVLARDGTTTPDGHFVLGDKFGQLLWDPDPRAKLGRVLDMRFYRGL